MIGGKARVGKTTAANILKVISEKLGMRPVIVPFAKAIKDEAIKAGLSKETTPEEYRAFCQQLGEAKRNEDPDYWVKKFEETFTGMAMEEDSMLDNPLKKYKERIILIDDCRYLNELGFGRTIGAKQIFIAHGDRSLDDHDADWRKHHSEEVGNKTELMDKDYDQLFEYRLVNNGTMNSFVSQLSELSLVLFNVIAESLTMCECEVCMSFRQGRKVNTETLMQEISDLVEDIYKKKETKNGET